MSDRYIYLLSLSAVLFIILVALLGALDLAFQQKQIPADVANVIKGCFAFLVGLHLPSLRQARLREQVSATQTVPAVDAPTVIGNTAIDD